MVRSKGMQGHGCTAPAKNAIGIVHGHKFIARSLVIVFPQKPYSVKGLEPDQIYHQEKNCLFLENFVMFKKQGWRVWQGSPIYSIA